MQNLTVYLNPKHTHTHTLLSSPLRSLPSLIRLTRIFSLISLSCMSVSGGGSAGLAGHTQTLQEICTIRTSTDVRGAFVFQRPRARSFLSCAVSLLALRASARSCPSNVAPPPSLSLSLSLPVFSNSSCVRHATTFLTHQTTMRPPMGPEPRRGNREVCVCVIFSIRVCVCVCV